ncbi:MAG: phospholipase D-like domain-containing protein [Bdellovibrionia bacterium]
MLHRMGYTKSLKARVIFFWFFLLNAAPLFASPIQFAIGPDCNQSLLLNTLSAAEQSLLINIYQLDHPTIVQAILEKLTSGVQVRLILEGHPVGGITQAGKQAIDQIRDSMIRLNLGRNLESQNRFYLMTPQRGQPRRYRFNHAKYVIADEKKVLISSENFTPTGHSSPGQKGNRGWDITLEDPRLIEQLKTIFQIDSENPNDIQELTQSTEPLSLEIQPQTPLSSSGETSSPAAGQIQIGRATAQSIALITSPHSLEEITTLIQSAQTSIEVQEMSLPLNWTAEKTSPRQLNPLVKSLIEAAERGVQVRILLNDETVFAKPQKAGTHPETPALKATRNEETCMLIRWLADCKHLPISAEILDNKKAQISYIHNKGFIIDGSKVLVSSINGTRNSLFFNREVAVLVESPEAASYFQQIFLSDWQMPLAPRIEPPKLDCSEIDTLDLTQFPFTKPPLPLNAEKKRKRDLHVLPTLAPPETAVSDPLVPQKRMSTPPAPFSFFLPTHESKEDDAVQKLPRRRSPAPSPHSKSLPDPLKTDTQKP